jgi:hypothetical protein
MWVRLSLASLGGEALGMPSSPGVEIDLPVFGRPPRAQRVGPYSREVNGRHLVQGPPIIKSYVPTPLK